ncbi:MAG: hypothetical protein ABIO44_10820, partial [Saprospiraceae bacterium]
TLIDDISIFECPGDIEAPKVMNEPINEEYNCIDELPSPTILDVVDDCDINPIIKFSEKRNKKDECEQTILRNWEVSDHCGNSKIINQEIKVVDLEPPKIIQSGSNKYINCANYSNAAFSTWLNTHGGAVATDNCKKVFWEYSYDQLPKFACDTTIVTFSAKDNCGNESLIYLYYILTDTLKPRLVKSADIVRLQCSKFAKDSLRSWLLSHGNAQAIDSCSPISWKNNFNGDSNALKIVVDFMAFDKCGNKLLVPGLFEQIDAPDTNYITSFNCFTKKIKTDTTFFNLPGCDSVVINKILGLQLDTTFFNKISCDPNQKQEIIHLISNNTCDSIILFSYQYQAPDTNRLSEFICGKKDTSIIYETFKGIFCDSIILKTQFPGIENIQNIVKYLCDTSQVGISNFNFTNRFGCDSIIQIDTRFNAVSISQHDSLVCGLKTNYYDTLKYSIANCDSLHIIHYLGLVADTTKINKSTCDPLNVGIKINKYNNLNQCDSLVIINTTFVPIQPSIIQQNTCDPFHKLTDSLFLKSSQSCDSLIITTYLIKAIDTTKIYKTTCDPNHVLLELKKINGQFCDSIVITNFSYQPADLAYQSIRTCNKDSIRTDTMAYSNQNLCDSLIIINYVYKPIELNYLTKDITCYGYMDGTLEISKLLNAQAPLQFILDQKVYSTQLKWNNLDKGLHTLYLIDNDGCFSDSVVLDIKEPAPIKIDIGKDLLLNKSEQIIFSEKSNIHFTSYHWNPSGLFDC